jgi:hypothetical protein
MSVSKFSSNSGLSVINAGGLSATLQKVWRVKSGAALLLQQRKNVFRARIQSETNRRMILSIHSSAHGLSYMWRPGFETSSVHEPFKLNITSRQHFLGMLPFRSIVIRLTEFLSSRKKTNKFCNGVMCSSFVLWRFKIPSSWFLKGNRTRPPFQDVCSPL